jgi:glycosyltransferase involved in cell wall biosynthesis
MKTLHIGLCVDGKNEGLPYALAQASTEYYEINPGDTQIISKLTNLPFKPDLVFCQIQSETIQGSVKTVDYLGQHLQRLRDAGAFVMNWSGDMRAITPQWYFDMAKHVSMTTFSNMQDVNNLRAKGFASDFLQIGIDPLVFRPDGDKLNVPEIIFMANNYGNQFPLSGYRKQVVDFLKKEYGPRFRVYGNGWQPVEQSFNHSQLEEAKAYRGAKIAISVSHFDSDRYTSDRLLRAMACGCAVVSHQYKGMAHDFEWPKQLLTFYSVSGNLKEVVDFLLYNESKREQIRTHGHKHIMENHTYKHMVENIKKLMK